MAGGGEGGAPESFPPQSSCVSALALGEDLTSLAVTQFGEDGARGVEAVAHGV